MTTLHSFRLVAARLVWLAVLVMVLATTASAYTLIMRSGRRIEIPDKFVVTSSTLTYETAPGIQVTLQMAGIDIAATERANNEPSGSLLGRIQVSRLPAKDDYNFVAPTATRTITNRDLEATANRRRQSELAYDVRRKQLGLPSVAESQQRRAAEVAAIDEELTEKRVAQRDSEEYWRSRASDLRTEMVALDAELNYIKNRLDQIPQGWGASTNSFTSVIPLISFGGFGGRSFRGFGGNRGFDRGYSNRSNVYVAPGTVNTQSRRSFGFGGRNTRRQDNWNRGQYGYGPYGQPNGIGIGYPIGGFPGANVFGSSMPDDHSYERNELITRFNDLAATRAGMNARWRELEEEARRAGASPGWLRP